MRHVSRLPAAALPFLLACGGAAPAASSTPPSAQPPVVLAPPSPLTETTTEHLARDMPLTTPGGATFTAPAGWWLQSETKRRILTGPEPDLRVAIVDVTTPNADDAVAAAWPALESGFHRPLRLAQPRPARHGWDEHRDYDYETSPDEKLVVGATALRRGGDWTVLLVESSLASFDKRSATLSLVGESLRPRGYARESFAGKTPHALDADRIKRIVDVVEQGRQALGIPGVALSLVQGGKVVFEGGLGVRELGKPAKVDPDTLFLIASNTKAMSTLLLAKEVDEGKFTWETPVADVYPGFKLGDAETTRQVRMKHLICACTGLPRQDMEWLFEFKNATPATTMDLLGTIQPTTKFGETFQYSNLLAAAAGFVGGHLAYPKRELGAAYDEAMQTRVFGPLGMKATTFDYGRALAGDHAAPHGMDVDGKMAVASMDLNRSAIPLRPAGGAWSNVRDVTRYVQMELADGKLPDGKPFVSAKALRARRDPQVSMGESTTYGMGLMVDSRYDVPIVHHGGDLIGFHSDMFWLPDQGVGGVILTNGDGGWLLRAAFLRKVLEELYDGKPEALEDVTAAAKSEKAEIAKDRERLVMPPAPEATARLAKHYRSKALGEIVVTTKGPAVTFDFGEWKSAVASRKNDDGTTSMVTVDPGVGGDVFVVGERNGKRTLVVRDMQHEYAFEEVP
ncbi:MAG TPA: serine hydrolase domain-containing protein [Polyangiaceae bacterium]|jgi:CubicO group peptidase (beta-lactamase class C family)